MGNNRTTGESSSRQSFGAIGTEQRSILNSLLGALKLRDCDTYEHSRRSVRLCVRVGSHLRLSQAKMPGLRIGALLHDIGKIGIPDAILKKPAPLSRDEWKEMRHHPRIGGELVRGLDFLPEARQVIEEHHESWDGSGYPMGLAGESISICARIVAVADAFDAMTNDRVYRARRTVKEAMAELEHCAGSQFDPRVVEAFGKELMMRF